MAIERMRERICFTEMSIKVNPVRNTQFGVLNILFLEKFFLERSIILCSKRNHLLKESDSKYEEVAERVHTNN